MAMQDPIKRKRETRERYKTYINLPQASYEALLQLHEQEPDKNMSQIVGECLRFAHQLDIYKPARQHLQMAQAERGVPDRSTGPAFTTQENRKYFCEKYGGVYDGVNVRFMKYEVTPTGIIIKREMSMPLKSMPNSQAEIQKMILGKFVTVAHAEDSYEKNKEGAELAPVKMLGKK
jgi:hypothetical protein